MALKMLLIALVASLLAMNPANALTGIVVKNLCNESITACVQWVKDSPRSYLLSANGGSQDLEVRDGSYESIWGFPGFGSSEGCEQAKSQADVATIRIQGDYDHLDRYFISNMYAYNLPLAIIPQRNGCRSISCSIPDLGSFCQAPNGLTGSPGYGCENYDGQRKRDETEGSMQFKIACPDAIAYSGDIPYKRRMCRSGYNYEVTFCPGNAVGAEILQVVSAATS